MSDPDAVVDALFAAFAERGRQLYGEDVTVEAHCLQAAHLAEQAGAPPELVCAALLHDYGHLLTGQPDDIADAGVDTRHEDLGADALAAWFGPEVTEPIRLHVEAKRYRCGRSAKYVEALSAASVQSLALQGGPLGAAERSVFEARPHAPAAITLRGLDDAAKARDATTPPLEHYRPLLRALMRAPQRRAPPAV